MELCTHLNFDGTCEAAFQYYAEHLGGEITFMFRVRDLPPGSNPPHASPDHVIHAVLEVAGTRLIGNDVPNAAPVRSSYLYLSVDSDEEAERVYAALLEGGGKAGMEMQETFFATRFAQVRDRFGVLWTLLHQRSR